jgi:hypothetical protein
LTFSGSIKREMGGYIKVYEVVFAGDVLVSTRCHGMLIGASDLQPGAWDDSVPLACCLDCYCATDAASQFARHTM